MNAKHQLAQRMARRSPGEDQLGFIRGYTTDKRVPSNQRLWSPYNSSWMFSNKMKKHR